MTFRSSIAASAAVFSIALFLTPSVHAESQKPTTTETKPAVVATVQPGDSLTSIAQNYNMDYSRLFDANDAITNPDIINPGEQIRIPDVSEQLPDRLAAFEGSTAAPQQAAVQTTTGKSYAIHTSPTRASSAGNTYYYGYCTWYAKSRRPDLPNRLGNGGQWVANAAALGYATGSAPHAGAIAEEPGHVAYVESVNGNGTVTISEMNGAAGFGVVDTRVASASEFRYIY